MIFKKTIHFILLIFILLYIPVHGQIKAPKLKWEIDKRMVNDSLCFVDFNVKLENHWHIYSIYCISDTLPCTRFYYYQFINCTLDSIYEIGNIKFDKDLKYYKDNATFRLILNKKKLDTKSSLLGAIEYTVCYDTICCFHDSLEFGDNRKLNIVF